MNKISITPIGTCRINTPLKRGAARYPIHLDLQRIFGFVHTSEEALQQLMYRIGERGFPEDVVPILFRPGMDCTSEAPAPSQADLTIIEISSGKTYLVGDVAVQSNYLTRHFADFFAAPRRARAFWDLARRGDRALVEAFVARDRAAQLYSEEDRSILSRLRLHVQTFEDVFADMAKMTEILGKDRILFVTHVNTKTPDGNIVANRDKLIRWVKLAAQRLGAECFDPTQLMEEVGQERAMERDGLDLTHFTNPFCDRWFGKVYRDFVVGRMVDGGFQIEATTAGEADLLAEGLASAMANGDFFEASRQLFAALKNHPDNVALRLLHGDVLEKIGDFQGALDVLGDLVGSAEMTAEVRQSYARVLLETGDAAGALATTGQLLADEYENDEIYAIAGSAAERLGDVEQALLYRKLAFRLDPANHAAALAVLSGYRETGGADLFAAWLDELFEVVESRGDVRLALAIGQWAMSCRDGALLSRVLLVVARNDVAQLFVVIEEAIQFDMALALLDAAQVVAELPDLPGKAVRALGQLAQAWALAARRALEADQLPQAHSLAQRSLALVPGNPAARRVERASVVALVGKLRAATGDAAIIALCEAAGDMIYERRVMASLLARALVNQGRQIEAQEVARRIHAREPDDIEVRAECAMIAANSGNFVGALEMYGELAREPADAILRHETRIYRFLATAAQKGLRYARQLAGHGQFEQAMSVFDLIDRYLSVQSAVARERDRTFGAMRAIVRDAQAAGGDAASARMPVLRTLIQHDTSDAAAQLCAKQVRCLLGASRFEEALEAAGLLGIRPALAELQARQFDQIRSRMRLALRELDAAGSVAPESALRILRLSLQIAPEDQAVLRRAAIEAMRLGMGEDGAGLAEAREMLARLLAIDPSEGSIQLLVRHARALTGNGLFEHAIALMRLLADMPGMEPRMDAELVRIRSGLRLALRQIDDDDSAEFGEAQRLLALMLEIEPKDPSVLRRAAIEAMRAQDFDGALALWRRLEQVAPTIKSVANNISRCEIMQQRQSRKIRLAQHASAIAA